MRVYINLRLFWGLLKKGRANYFMNYDNFKKGLYINSVRNNSYSLWD